MYEGMVTYPDEQPLEKVPRFYFHKLDNIYYVKYIIYQAKVTQE